MKKLIYSMLALLCVAFTFTSCSDNDAQSENDPSKGSKNNPYTVAEAIDVVKDFTWTSNDEYDKTGEVYVKGKISRIVDNGTFAASGTFSNATFYISNDGAQNNEFYCYRILYLNNQKHKPGQTDIKVGDEVVICGKLMNYKNSTPETVALDAYLYSLNGATDGGPGYEGDGSKDNPYAVAEAIDVVKDFTWTSNDEYDKTGEVYVKGKISRIVDNGTFAASGTFSNATFYISNDGAQNNEFYCYRILYFDKQKYKEGQTDIKVGDDVIICGKLMNYKNGTPETVALDTYLYSLNGETDGGPGYVGGDGSKDNPYSVAEALDVVKDLTWTSNTEYDKTGDVYVKGKISKIANKGTYTEGGTYGNASFYISDDGAQNNEFYCFRILYFDKQKFETGQTDIKVGDDVVICGKMMNYKNGTPETVSGDAYLVSLNGKTESDQSVSFTTNSESQTWATATDATYGSGYATTTKGLNIGYYKHTGSSNPLTPNANQVRLYKNSVLSIASTEGKKIKKIVIGCAPNAGTSTYCYNMVGLEGGANAVADKDALTVTWNGSANKVILQANEGQVRMEEITVVFE